MKSIFIAQIAHIINSAFCTAISDPVAPAWDECPEDMRLGMQAGVQFHLDNPDTTPEQSHESWLADKLAKGWVYGEVKDIEAKVHPNIVPYAELSVHQKAKDYLFGAVVQSLKGLPDNEDLQALQAQITELQGALAKSNAVGAGDGAAVTIAGVAVEYIGHKATYIDRLYKTGIEFAKGEVKVLPAVLARQFLRHADLFAKASAEQAASADPAEAGEIAKALAEKSKESTETEKREREIADLHQQIALMDLAALNEIGSRYGLKFGKSKRLDKARAELSNKIDQLGVL